MNFCQIHFCQVLYIFNTSNLSYQRLLCCEASVAGNIWTGKISSEINCVVENLNHASDWAITQVY